jgi:lipid II:glycine glycyltransferase (peptidoglycan interpeptide bridge formation enzyme)
LAAGHVILLEVRTPDDELIGGATFYRHGGRLTYSHSGDRADLRRSYPGVIHFLLWRAIQLAVRQSMVEVDLAGVDVRGARRQPVAGEEMLGLYEFKRSFGATWIELTGNHERVARAWRYGLGRVTGRLLGAGQ